MTTISRVFEELDNFLPLDPKNYNALMRSDIKSFLAEAMIKVLDEVGCKDCNYRKINDLKAQIREDSK